MSVPLFMGKLVGESKQRNRIKRRKERKQRRKPGPKSMATQPGLCATHLKAPKNHFLEQFTMREIDEQHIFNPPPFIPPDVWRNYNNARAGRMG